MVWNYSQVPHYNIISFDQNSYLGCFSWNTIIVLPQEFFCEMKFSFCSLNKQFGLCDSDKCDLSISIEEKRKLFCYKNGKTEIFLAKEVFFGSPMIIGGLVPTSLFFFIKSPNIRRTRCLTCYGPCHGWSRSVWRLEGKEGGAFGTVSHCWLANK